MRYPIKTPSQLPLVIKGFRKARGLTQAMMAQRLGITQQSYAYFEANPASATLDRLFVVMRILGVEIALDQTDAVGQDLRNKGARTVTPAAKAIGKPASTTKISGSLVKKTAYRTGATGKLKSATASSPRPVTSSTRKREAW